ncbi:MAG: amino acid ABC transporter substrate-binding protein [Actinomycetia bacterium]|nr:amino acid ABC transporter substrate-binding protein [Actinomycetes bacterium]
MKNRRALFLSVVLLTLALMAVLFATACGEEEPATTTAAPTTAPPTTAAPTTAPPTTGAPTTAPPTTGGAVEYGEDLVIGAINSITGVNALTGGEQKWAQEKAVEDINAKGGIKLADGKMHKVALKFADDKSSDTEAAAAMEKLIKSEGIKIILSSNTTPYNQAAATVAEQYQAYFHICTSWTDEGFIGGMGLKWSTDIFESAADSGLVAMGAAKQLGEGNIPTKWAVMYENNPDGIGWGDGQKALITKEGWEIVSDEKFVEGNKDFSSMILKYKEAGAEAVDVLISPADGITFVRQMKEQNWSPKYMFGFKGFWPVEFYKGLGADADYIGHDSFWTETYPYPYAKELGQAFRDTHNGDASVTIGLPYAAAQILFMAIERAGVFEPGPVRDQVFNGSFPGTVMGDVKYNEKGIADIPFLSQQWLNGEHRLVWPEEFAVGPTLPFVPWDQR